MFIHSRLWRHLANWPIRSHAAYAATYARMTGRRPVGEHEVPLLGLGGFLVTFQFFELIQRNPTSEPIAKAHGKYDERLVRAYRSALGHYLANKADEPAQGPRE